jgi:hypothetical protein
MKTKTYRNTYLPLELDEWLKNEAKKVNRSVNSFIVHVLSEHRDAVVARGSQNPIDEPGENEPGLP